MVSKTEICNKALIKLGANTIKDINTDQSKQATLCNAVYDACLSEVLREHTWNFAVTRRSLNKDASGSPVYGFENRFILPTNPALLRLISTENDIAYRLEGGYLVTDEETVKIKYIAKITEPNAYDPTFIDALSLRIGYEIAFALTNQTNLVDSLKKEYLYVLSNARAYNNEDDKETPIEVSNWTNARIRGGDYLNVVINA